MKKLFFLFALFSGTLLAQTYAEIAGPENVLVVYNSRDSIISESIMLYYQNARNIPESNILPLDSLKDSVYHQGNLVTLEYNGERITSANNSAAWYYYKERIADVIETHLNSTYVQGVQLKSKIKYIVLCKGVPLTVQTSTSETSLRKTVSVDGLVCLLYNNIIPLYNTNFSNQPNPYYLSADTSFTFNFRFKTNHFTNVNGMKLNYLVSRLDADSYSDVIGMIDRSVNSDKTGKKYWVLDADTCHNTDVTLLVHNGNYIKTALENLKDNLFFTNPNQYDPDCNFITSNSNGQVIGYTSCGYHSWLGLVCQDSVY